MSYRAVIVEAATRKTSARGTDYLSVRYHHAGETLYASCWHEDCWKVIEKAIASGSSTVLDITESETRDQSGKPFLNIVGYEHPGQGRLF